MASESFRMRFCGVYHVRDVDTDSSRTYRCSAFPRYKYNYVKPENIRGWSMTIHSSLEIACAALVARKSRKTIIPANWLNLMNCNIGSYEFITRRINVKNLIIKALRFCARWSVMQIGECTFTPREREKEGEEGTGRGGRDDHLL